MIKHLAGSFILLGSLSTTIAAPELIQINDAGNPGEAIHYGSFTRPYPRGKVNYPYRIGKREVTNAEYAEFLNATGKGDEQRLFNPKMKISRNGKAGSYTYVAKAGFEAQPVNFVRRTDAARYCNWLSGAEVYKVADRQRERGQVVPVIVGFRNLTSPDKARLYYLPDIHEFHKAAFYDGKGKYRNVSLQNRRNPSHYGMINYASGTQEWVEDKYYGGATILLGAIDKDTDPKKLNGILHRQLAGHQSNANTGFRIAATAPLAIAPKLNNRNNFFIDKENKGTIRLRCDQNKAQKLKIDVVIKNYRKQIISSKQHEIILKKGINDLAVSIPAPDGYYELEAVPHDRSFNGQKVIIPFMVMRQPMPDWKLKGNFGFTVHITRWEKRFTFENVDFDLMRQLGAGIIRVDVRYNDTDGNQTALKRIRKNGFRPLGIITASGIYNYGSLAENQSKYPEYVKKWTGAGIPPMAAYYAENVFNLVSRNKQWCTDWEMGNEPTYWRILAQDYTQLVKGGYKAAKLADPSCNVMMGDINAIHEPVLSLRGGDFCDSIASHIYGFYVPSFWGIIGKMRSLNGWKSAVGIPDKPIWLTEIGVCTYNHMHTLPLRSLNDVRHYQAIHVPKSMAGGMAFGASKILNYNFRDVPVESLEEEFGMVDRYGCPKPATMSYRTTARLLGNAKFVGFMKGHSAASGGIAGLLFKQPSGKKVLALWRNDTYGQSKFQTPLDQLIKPPKTLEIPADEARLITIDGNAKKLTVRNGKVTVRVDEYPVFVCGSVRPEIATVKIASNVPKVNFNEAMIAKVKILPPKDNQEKCCNMMSGISRTFTINKPTKITIHVYNLQSKQLSGSVKLESPVDWRTWKWDIQPKYKKVTIPANGMASVTFIVKANEGTALDKLYYLGATFESDSQTKYTDRIMCKVVPEQVNPKRWITYSPGYEVGANSKKTELELSWKVSRKLSWGSFYLKTPSIFAQKENELNKQLTLNYNPGKARLIAISLLFMDNLREIFQIKQRVSPKLDKWNKIIFETNKIITDPRIIHYSGNKNGKVDFPVKFLGFNFDLYSKDSKAGKIKIKPFEFK